MVSETSVESELEMTDMGKEEILEYLEENSECCFLVF